MNDELTLVEQLQLLAKEAKDKRRAEDERRIESDCLNKVRAILNARNDGQTTYYELLKESMFKAAKNAERSAEICVGTDPNFDIAAVRSEALCERLVKEGISYETTSQWNESYHDSDCGWIGFDGYSYHVTVRW